MVSVIRLTTENLILRELDRSDAPRMIAYYNANRHHLDAWEPPRAFDFYEVSAWEKRIAIRRDHNKNGDALHLAVFTQLAPERVIGVVNFTEIVRGSLQACRLGYGLDAQYLGRGVITEALQATIPYVFDEMHLHRIMANYMPENERSARLLARLGFTIEGLAREYLYINGRWRDHVLSSLTNSRRVSPGLPSAVWTNSAG